MSYIYNNMPINQQAQQYQLQQVQTVQYVQQIQVINGIPMQVTVPVVVTQNVLVNANQPVANQPVANQPSSNQPSSNQPIVNQLQQVSNNSRPNTSSVSTNSGRPMMDPITPPTYQTINLSNANGQIGGIGFPVNFVIRR